MKKISIPKHSDMTYKYNSSYTPNSSIQIKKGFLKLNQNNINDDSFSKICNNNFINNKKNYEI